MTTDTAAGPVEPAARLARTAPGPRAETGPGATGSYAYDSSDYRVPPRAVAFPRGADDVAAVLRACRETGVPVTARGGGTSRAASGVGPGVVLDFSRYMNRTPDIDPQAGTARVEAGVVLDALRDATAPHGLISGAGARLDGVDQDGPTVVVADCFSCATRIDHLAEDRGAPHLAELLHLAADQAVRPGETS